MTNLLLGVLFVLGGVSTGQDSFLNILISAVLLSVGIFYISREAARFTPEQMKKDASDRWNEAMFGKH